MNTPSPIDLDDSKHELQYYKNSKGSECWKVINVDGSQPAVTLQKIIYQNGTIGEGQLSKVEKVFTRVLWSDGQF